jgi:hypothetical protein
MPRPIRPVALFLAALLVAGHSVAVPAQYADIPAGTATALQATLYFGMTSRDGSGVSEQEWADFLRTVVTPRFPNGFTVVGGYGQWRNGKKDEIIKEDSRMLVLTYVAGRKNEAKVDEIKAAYTKRFRQDAVFHTRTAIEIID